METLLKKYLITDIGEDARRQYIDAQSVFVERERTRKEASSVSGSMFWRQQSGREYLIRQTASNAQKSLGPRSADTENTLERFTVHYRPRSFSN